MASIRIEMPEAVDVAAFHAGLEHVAEFILRKKETRDKLFLVNPVLLDKTMLAQELAVPVLQALIAGPSGHLVALAEAPPEERWNCSGKYVFLEPIPVNDVLNAFVAILDATITDPRRNIRMNRGILRRVK